MTFWRWLKFNSVGAAGIVVQVAALTLLIRLFGIPYLLATVIAVELAVLHNFCWHVRWTWRDRTASLAQQLWRFHLSNGLISIAGNLVLMRLLVGRAGLDPFPANLLSIAGCSVINFVLCDRFVFRSAKSA